MDEEDDEPRICSACIGEAFLKAEVERTGEKGSCAYCQGEGLSITVDELADFVDGAFEEHYFRTSDQPNSWQQTLLSDRESNYDWERDGEPVIWAIAGAAEIEEEPATDIQAILEERYSDFESDKMGEETAFAEDSCYGRRGPNDVEWQMEWRAFERNLKTETRFFSRAAEAVLKSVFAGIENHQTHDDRPVIIEAGPGLEIDTAYRARLFDNDEDLEIALKYPDREIGPPPPRHARAGRMNAQGISVFYGALDGGVALAEIRPPVGSRVVVARFEIIRRVRLLDVEALRSVYVEGSIFDGGYMRRLELAKFLESVSSRMTMPVMPNDEPFDYLITQAIADYLATEMGLDGILFPSVQQGEGERNIVLFHKAARVEALEIPDGTEFMVKLFDRTDDGEEPDYWVFEEVPKPPEQSTEQPDGLVRWGDFPPLALNDDYDARELTLRIDVRAIDVHAVQAVSFETVSNPVRRHRSEKRDWTLGGGSIQI